MDLIENETVAFHPDGKPMIRKEYIAAIDIANKQIEEGDFILVEEFENE